MTRYAVGYTVGDSAPEENADGEEYVPEHAVPIVDGVAVAGQPVLADDEDEGEQDEAPRCTETTASGEPCKNTAGDDGLCGVHRKKAADPDPATTTFYGDDSKLSK